MWTRERRLALLGARLLKVILVLSWLGGILALLFVAVYIFMTATGRGGVDASLTLPVKLTLPEDAYTISAAGVRLVAEGAGIVLPLAATPWVVQVLVLSTGLCACVFCIYLIYYLQKMFAGFAAGRPFQVASVRAIQLVAWGLIVNYAFAQLYRLLSVWVLARTDIVGVSVTRPPLLGTSAELDLAAGTTLLFIAWAFDHAAKVEKERDVLQEEHEFTV